MLDRYIENEAHAITSKSSSSLSFFYTFMRLVSHILFCVITALNVSTWQIQCCQLLHDNFDEMRENRDRFEVLIARACWDLQLTIASNRISHDNSLAVSIHVFVYVYVFFVSSLVHWWATKQRGTFMQLIRV